MSKCEKIEEQPRPQIKYLILLVSLSFPFVFLTKKSIGAFASKVERLTQNLPQEAQNVSFICIDLESLEQIYLLLEKWAPGTMSTE